jgi:hypothetical protein
MEEEVEKREKDRETGKEMGAIQQLRRTWSQFSSLM